MVSHLDDASYVLAHDRKSRVRPTNFEDFRAEVPPEDLSDLHRRLDATRWPDQLPDAGWSYGVELGRLREVTDHWQTSYDWRRFEDRLNVHPQYVTEIDGQRVHYVRAGSSGTPLLLLHGRTRSNGSAGSSAGSRNGPGTPRSRARGRRRRRTRWWTPRSASSRGISSGTTTTGTG
ncbi:epoxide hydrolase N-terminal domain-containing protein [Kribbella sp. NPDC050459]|uniref:epoxide hydrolase N-terminal domain-containing protein n=1 Tax=Kribbella sp. NPDC050459 TaxID=3155785 RepID=UPI0033CE55CF